MARIIKDDIDKLFQYGIDLSTKTLVMDSVVDEETSQNMIKGLHVLDNIKPKEPITIIMENYGGSVYSGLAIYDFISNCESEVIVKVYGACMSMAAYILQAAETRLIAKHARIMIHTGYTEFHEDHPEIHKRWMKQYEKDDEELEDILLERIREKHPEFTREEVKQLLMFDSILLPKKAVELGLADDII